MPEMRPGAVYQRRCKHCDRDMNGIRDRRGRTRWICDDCLKYVCGTCRQRVAEPLPAYRRCKPCSSEKERARRERMVSADPDFIRSINLRKFGLTAEQYDEIEQAQKGQCAVCGQAETARRRKAQDRPDRLAIHHDHRTGRIIALLCSACNLGLGKLNDDPTLLRRAAELMEDESRWWAMRLDIPARLH